MVEKGSIFIVLISILLTISLFILATLVTANSLLYPDIYMDSLNESEVTELVQESINNLTGEQFIEIQEQEIKILMEDLLTQFLAYMRGDNDTLELTINVDQERIRDLLILEIENLPICNDNQISFNIEDESICRPSNQTAEELLDMFLETSDIELPENQINLAEVYEIDTSELENIREQTKKIKPILYGLIFLVILFSITILIIAKDPKEGSKVLGINILITGIFVFVASLIPSSFTSSIPIEVMILKDLVISLVDGLVSKLRVYGFGSIILGIILAGIPLIIEKRNNQNK